ncbi:MAG TPA: hypothetical protein VEZ14_14015 [Dehalococcoidia bacterium]|nr:hypothetical protein [Dehalococcoidia bacterium]
MGDAVQSPETGSIGTLEILDGIRALAVATLAGVLSGAVAFGVGSRLAMRITALQASSIDQGRLTDAQATVGAITADGTAFLIALGAGIGAVGGLLYAAARGRLAWAGRWRGLAFGMLLLAVFGSAIVEGSNPDFDRFGVPLVNVAMFSALFLFFGVLIAPVYENLQRAVPRPRRSLTTYALVAPQAAGLVLLAPATGIAFAVLLPAGDHTAFAGLALVSMAVYLLVVAPSMGIGGRLRGAAVGRGSQAAIASLAPLAPPVLLGIALDVRELTAIF